MNRRTRGFSATELVVATAIILTVSAFAIPAAQRNWQVYRLSGSANEVATFLQRGRFEAMRRNTTIPTRAIQQERGWLLWIDTNRNGRHDGAEPAMMLSGGVEFLTAGEAPSAESMGYGVTASPQGAIAFDSRGTVNFGGQQPAVLTIFLGYPEQPDRGYRAVTVLPAGRTKVWRAEDGGRWHSQ